MYTLLFFSAIFLSFPMFDKLILNMNLDHMYIEPHGIRTMSKQQSRAGFGNLGHLATAIK